MSDLRGFKELSTQLNKIEDRVAKRILKRGASKFAQEIRKEVKQQAPVKTGALKRGIRLQVRQKKAGYVLARVGPSADQYYGRILEKGAKRHRIPKKRGAKVSINGQVLSGIEHPGIRPNKFLSRAFKARSPRALREAGKTIFKLIKQL